MHTSRRVCVLEKIFVYLELQINEEVYMERINTALNSIVFLLASEFQCIYYKLLVLALALALPLTSSTPPGSNC